MRARKLRLGSEHEAIVDTMSPGERTAPRTESLAGRRGSRSASIGALPRTEPSAQRRRNRDNHPAPIFALGNHVVGA